MSALQMRVAAAAIVDKLRNNQDNNLEVGMRSPNPSASSTRPRPLLPGILALRDADERNRQWMLIESKAASLCRFILTKHYFFASLIVLLPAKEDMTTELRHEETYGFPDAHAFLPGECAPLRRRFVPNISVVQRSYGLGRLLKPCGFPETWCLMDQPRGASRSIE